MPTEFERVKFDYRKIGERIRERRKEQGKTQDELAQLVGVTKTAISNIERGGNEGGSNVGLFANIAIVLDMSLDELFDIQAHKNSFGSGDNQSFKAIKDFITFFHPEVVTYEADNTGYYETKLIVSDYGTQYFIQEYNEFSGALQCLGGGRYDKEISKYAEISFDEKITDRMSYSDKRLIFKDSSIYLQERYDGEGIRIVEAKRPSETEIDCPF